MRVVIHPEQLSSCDLRAFNEIWLADHPAQFVAEHAANKCCLWRGEQLFTHDMLSEGTHGQNVAQLWVLVADPSDLEGLRTLELAITRKLREQELRGEFHPAQAPA